MSSITDNVSDKTVQDAKEVAKLLKDAKKPADMMKGIMLMLSEGVEFTTENVMKAVNQVAYEKTGDIKYSNQNISLRELKEKGTVKKIDANVAADVMKYFDAACKKYEVHYTAMKDTANPDKPSYKIFFEARDTTLIAEAMKDACRDYMRDYAKQQSTQKEAGREEQQYQKEAGREGQQYQKEEGRGEQQEKESVKAKLSFFRDRTADREQENVKENRDSIRHQHDIPVRS